MDEVQSPLRRRTSSGSATHATPGQHVSPNEHKPVAHEDGDPFRSPSSDTMEMDDMASDEDLDDDEETGLTHAERKKRRRRKDDNSRLNERVAGDASSIRSTRSIRTEEKKLVDASIVRNITINALLIALWYSFSISISVYNKWMFSSENLDFHFPLFTTSLHMLIQFALASGTLFFFPRFRPGFESQDPSYAQLNSAETSDTTDALSSKQPPSKQPLMTKWFYLSRIGPCGTATALDIGLGNFSLRFITLTFFTMCKSSVLLFVLLFAFLFHLEQPTWRLCAIILLMTVGVIMMVAGETAFDALGFVLVMIASFCSGFRWSLTQILLLRNRATSNPFSSIFFLTPVMFLALFLLALPIEGPANVVQGIKELGQSRGGFVSFLLLLFPGFLAFLMVSAEFALLKRSSVVTLSVCGIFKEVLTISAAAIAFGDELTPINVSGLCVTIASIAAYNTLKYMKMRRDAVKDAQEEVEAEPAEERHKGVGDHDPGGADRRDSSSALMRDSLHVLEDDPEDDDNIDTSNANGVLHRPVKRPVDLE